MILPAAVIGRLRPLSEVIILAMACLAPWAIGGVDAWAQLLLEGGLLLLLVVELLTGPRSGWSQRVFCAPSLALGSLALLALVQAMPLPAALERTLAPATHGWRASLVPSVPQRVQGDSHPPVPPPAATLSHDPDASLRTAAQLAAAWLLFQCGLGLGSGTESLRRFGLITVANASLMTVFSIAQALAWNGKIYGIRTVSERSGWLTGGPFVCHNHLAAYLNLAFGLALGFVLAAVQDFPRLRRHGRPPRDARQGRVLLGGYAAGLLFAGIVVSHSRGGLLAMVCATALTLVVLRPRSIRLGASLGVMLGVTVLFLVVTGTATPFQRLASLADPTMPDHASVTGRLQVWGIALRAWRAFPVWGTGLGSFPAATAPFYSGQFGIFYFSHAENEYLQMLTEGGIIGLALALVALVMIARLGWRARNAAATPGDRADVLGALAAGLALMIQCLSDFPLHIPGVAVTGVILAAYLCRLGLDAGAVKTDLVASAAPVPWRSLPLFGRLAMVGLGVAILIQGIQLARVEALVRSVGLPFPGALMPTVSAEDASTAELNRVRSALEAALRLRPNWAEGHLRLGSVWLGLYSRLAGELIGTLQEEKDATATAILSDPLWLHRVVHSASAESLAALGGVLDHEPVRADLVPATRCFLEARRCSPDLGLTHARLAELDYLVDRGEPTSVHAARALKLTGYDYAVLLLAGQATAQAGDLDLAARCWRKALAIHEEDWLSVAIIASTLMTPEQILQNVLPPGARLPLLLADELYDTPEERDTRQRFLQAALERLPDQADVSPTERLWLEAQVRAGLDQRDRARKLMDDALVDEPLRPDWRAEYIVRLIEWGDPGEAARQARIGLTLHPDHAGIQEAAKAALDAHAQDRR